MNRTLTKELDLVEPGKPVEIRGYVDSVRNLGGITFVKLRDRSGTVQVTLDNSEKTNFPTPKKNDIVKIEGIKRQEEQASRGYEIIPSDLQIISSPVEQYPIDISPKSTLNLETILSHRPISLRNPKIRSIFSVQQTIAKSFRDYLNSQDFKEIFSPKIVSQGAEGGADVFKLDYFGKPVFLAQSPQFYKQMMVGSGFERVFEIGQVYRAEPHNTARHLSEYVSMDIEMGFIDSLSDLMDLEEGMLNYVFDALREEHSDVFKNFGVESPKIEGKIPRIPLYEMRDLIAKEKNKNFRGIPDIDPEGERFAAEIAKKNFGSELLFLTHYPLSARPFYIMPNKDNPELSESFDLILNGLEITTGGQRIHDYSQLVESMGRHGVPLDKCEGYLSSFKYGMPPHGGMGIGLERFTTKVLGLKNVREASLFPRDKNRFTP
jgi:nondiscriminating aspartyl-tRNA synthetase